MKKNSSLFGMQDVKFCKKCIMSNQKPNAVVEIGSKNTQRTGMKIEEDGICDACKYNEIKNNIDWDEREKRLLKILDKYRSNKGFDCIVPSSGGKDSSYACHVLKYKYNMNPLSVTWAPHLYTEIGWNNFTNHIHVGGVDNILFTPNGKLHRYLTKISFLNLLHPFQPFIIGQKSIGPKIASKFDIPLVIYGENTAEYGKSIDENYNPLMPKEYFVKKKNEKLYFGGKSIDEILNNTEFKEADFESYLPLDEQEVKNKDISVMHLGYFHKWDPQEMYYYAAKNTGFKANTERTEGTYSKYSSIDDKIDCFHYYTMFIKFGIGRASFDASQEIRNGKITREEGINLVKKYDSEFPKKYFKDFLNYIDIDEKTFWNTVDKFRSPHIWEKKDNQWKLITKLI